MARVHTSRQAVFVIKGEICVIIASLRRTSRWNSHQQDAKPDVILRKLQSLKESLDSGTKAAGLKIAADANFFLVPFLDVIRSEETSGPATALALSSIEKLIAYEIVNEANGSTGAVEAITDAVIHAHFVSTDSVSDELVLMKILHVLHHLFVSPLGTLLSNESVCELMQACFRMCFIERANELLRKSAEAALTDMICLLFSRLHSFPIVESVKKVRHSTPISHHNNNTTPSITSPTTPTTTTVIQASTTNDDIDTNEKDRVSSVSVSSPTQDLELESTTTPTIELPQVIENAPSSTNKDENSSSSNTNNIDGTASQPFNNFHIQSPAPNLPEIQVIEPTPQSKSIVNSSSPDEEQGQQSNSDTTPTNNAPAPTPNNNSVASALSPSEYKTKRGVKFTISGSNNSESNITPSTALEESSPAPPVSRGKITVPYGIPCVRELFRFLISLINPHEKQNSEVMIHLGLKLLLVAIETGVDSISKHVALMSQVKNDLCKNLIALLSYQPPNANSLLASSSILLNVLRILLLIFDSCRHLLKFQLEVFFTRLGELIMESTNAGGGLGGPSGGGGGGGSGSNSSLSANGIPKWNYEQREIAIDFLVQLWKLPRLVTELYLNYDCDLYCSNLFEDTTKLLSKNAFPLQTGINSIHLYCLDGLISILDGIESHCTLRIVTANNTSTSNLNNTSLSSVGSDESNSSVFYHDTQYESHHQQQQHHHRNNLPSFNSPLNDNSTAASTIITTTTTTTKTKTTIALSKDINFDDDDEEEEDDLVRDKNNDNNEDMLDLPNSPSTIVNNEPGAVATAAVTVGSFGSVVVVTPQPRKGFVNTGSNRVVEETLLPTHEQLMAIRHKKKILHSGSEHFNTQASKGIEFLQQHGLLSTPADPKEIVHFLRENPLLDKRAIGDYISAKKRADILHSFVRSFDFSNTRVDEALRVFLETFRLPGEAPLISFIMEEFADHWSISNGNPFADVDAAYRLGYAVIMLNVDQHNTNVKKQGNSMTWEDFKKNLRGLNGGEDFNPEMLNDIYTAIKSEEIIMPAEQTGLVKENYMWKVLLRRGMSPACKFQTPANDEGILDHDLFSLSWGPIVAALSFIFDKTTDSNVIAKTLAGFRKCSTIAAHYGMSDVFDNLIISLCKFTTLLSNNPDLGQSFKAQAACRTMFQLVHRHGDILREGWHNFIDCLVSLFKLQILPKILTESEDFTEPSGRVSLVRRTLTSAPRVEAGLFSSLYSYIALSAADSPANKSSVADDEENRKRSQTLIIECRPELLLSESKFLQLDSLQELLKSLIYASPVPESKRKDYDEDASVFVIEMLLKITVQNRDRALSFWDTVREHLYAMILAAASNDMPYLLERSTVGLMRVALRLMRKEDLCPIILQSLKILLYLRPAAVIQLSQQMSFGLHEILKTTAANIHTAEEWTIIFTLLEYVGAGKVPVALTTAVNQQQQFQPLPVGSNDKVSMATNSLLSYNTNGGQSPSLAYPTLQHSISQDPIPQFGGNGSTGPVGYSSGSDRGYTSDSELEIRSSNENIRNANVSPAQSWILLTQDDQQQTVPMLPQSPRRLAAAHSNQTMQPSSAVPPTQQVERQLFYPDPKSLVKSCETLSFLVRDAAHITPDNFTLCVAAIRSFVEASTMKTRPNRSELNASQGKKKRSKKPSHIGGSDHQLNASSLTKSKSFPGPGNTNYDADESDSEDQIAASHQVSIQLLDLLHTLHLRAAQIFKWWQKENSDALIQNSGDSSTTASIWSLGWKPILQAIVILCSDSRKQVRTTALNYLKGALLVHDLQQLSAAEWYSCFNEVLFPLMSKLLEPLNPLDPMGMEETRMRAITILSRVFLQHLTPLLQLETFTPLWLQILDFLNKYMHHSERSELLVEAIPESLKNLLLVMETAGIFHTPDGYTRLWALTWEKIDSFLPSLRAELLRSVSSSAEPPRPHSPPDVHQHQQQQLQQQQFTAQSIPILPSPSTEQLPSFIPSSSPPNQLPIQPPSELDIQQQQQHPSAPQLPSPVSPARSPVSSNNFTIQMEE